MSISLGKLWQNIRKHFLTVRLSIVQWSPQGSDRSLGNLSNLKLEWVKHRGIYCWEQSCIDS